jgi:hypothetical protein
MKIVSEKYVMECAVIYLLQELWRSWFLWEWEYYSYITTGCLE